MAVFQDFQQVTALFHPSPVAHGCCRFRHGQRLHVHQYHQRGRNPQEHHHDLVDCMIALPGQLFYTTQIPVCLWFVARNKKNGKFRNRPGQTLFIDARKLGALVDRTHKDFSEEEIDKVATTYHAWRGEKDAGEYRGVPGFCKSASTGEIKEHGYVLTLGRYVGAAEFEDDGIPFEEKMAGLSATLYEQFAEAVIKKNLEVLGYGVE